MDRFFFIFGTFTFIVIFSPKKIRIYKKSDAIDRFGAYRTYYMISLRKYDDRLIILLKIIDDLLIV